jgi:hypothetical protein
MGAGECRSRPPTPLERIQEVFVLLICTLAPSQVSDILSGLTDDSVYPLCTSVRRFCGFSPFCRFGADNSSAVQQFARERCATLRKYAKLSEGDSQNGLEHHCQQPGYPQR